MFKCLMSKLNWNLEVLVEGGKLENPEKNSQSREKTNNKLNPHEIISGECLLQSAMEL